MHASFHFLHFIHRVPELPRVDLFVTTADPVLEPPIITANTVLSLLALIIPPTNWLAMFLTMVVPLLPSMLFWKLPNSLSFGYLSVRKTKFN